MSGTAAEQRLQGLLQRHRLMQPDEPVTLTPLTGGVSSDLWRVELPGRTLCVKGALAQLKVEQEWLAPTSRNRTEYEWLQFAGTVAPGQVPRVFAYDEQAGLFAMEFLPPEQFPVWKARLMAGHIDPEDAHAVGDLIGRLHAASAASPSTARTFATDDNFDALRVEPYFRVTGRANPDLNDRVEGLAATTAGIHLAVVHGDVSPKNILLGPHGPVLLDAECGWYGDPAFDLAFCLNHLLLKAVIRPDRTAELHQSAGRLVDGYLAHVDWEPAAELTTRVATLLPLLALARVDGASPVEYLTPPQRGMVRDLARARLTGPSSTIDALVSEWMLAVGPAPAGATQTKEQAP